MKTDQGIIYGLVTGASGTEVQQDRHAFHGTYKVSDFIALGNHGPDTFGPSGKCAVNRMVRVPLDATF
jgi:hypothetical protein